MPKTTLTLSELIAKIFKIYTVQTKSSMYAQSLVVEENALLHHREAVAAELGATDRKLKTLEADLNAAGHTSGGFWHDA